MDGNAGMEAVCDLAASCESHADDGTAHGTQAQDAVAAMKIEAVRLFCTPTYSQVDPAMAGGPQNLGGGHVAERRPVGIV